MTGVGIELSQTLSGQLKKTSYFRRRHWHDAVLYSAFLLPEFLEQEFFAVLHKNGSLISVNGWSSDARIVQSQFQTLRDFAAMV